MGTHIINELNKREYATAVTCRSIEDTQALYRNGSLGNLIDKIDWYECTLEDANSWLAATKGCDCVIHCASPFPKIQPKEENSIISVAREGTLNVLDACLKNNVKHVIVTSSMNAVAGSINQNNDYRYSANDWTDVNNPTLTPYDKSKTLAEKAAWEFCIQNPKLKLTTIAPGAIFGPLLVPRLSTSTDLIYSMLSGGVPALPNIGFAPVDVRDVAKMHADAIDNKLAISQRFLSCIDNVWLTDIASILRHEKAFPDYKVPSRTLSNWQVRFLSIFNQNLKRAIPHLGRKRLVDTAKTQDVFEWQPNNLQKMVLDTAKSLLEMNLIRKH